jgi:hypothetical protein
MNTITSSRLRTIWWAIRISFVFALWKQTKNIKNILDVPSLEIWTAAGPRMMVHQQDEGQQEE